ncbi:MAG: lipoxygenase family protein [Nostocaceae cyanobacterium]|nr:lipoxygenase family protein [Nostocaceae cyanobacterium]
MKSLLQNQNGRQNSLPKSELDLPTIESDKYNVETDDSPSKNNQELENARHKYKYNYTYIASIAMLDKLPLKEYPSIAWINLLAGELAVIFINSFIYKYKFLQILRNEVLKSLVKVIVQVIAKLVIYPLLLIKGFLASPNPLARILKFLGFYWILEVILSSLVTKNIFRFLMIADFMHHKLENKQDEKIHVNSLKEYNKLFTEIELPEIAYDFQEDEVFAYMQVAGYNPLMIERVKELKDNFPVTEAQYQEVMGSDDSLVAAKEEGRLYLADYQILKGAANGTFPKEQKYIYAPLVLFAVPKESDSSTLMRPVAIQCSQNPNDAPIVTPKSDKYAWLFAKTIVQIANANYHEAVSHLGRTHLFVGRFAIATHRQLPDDHPLSLLLCPHFKGTLNINNAAQEFLIAPRGGVDKLLAPTIDSSRALVEADLQNYSFNEAMLPKQLKKRGVEDTKKLPVYPYRDDACEIWKAIHQWVKDYLSIYYKSDKDVQDDKYLQNWALEAGDDNGARVHDFGEEHGRIQTLNYLIDATTLIIFTASAQHAAVNFPQKDIMSYAPAVPLAGYKSASLLKDKKGELSEQDYLNLLPPLEQAQGQLNLLDLLASVYYTKLGYYPDNYFQDSFVKTALEKFQENLQKVEAQITKRNRLSFTYTYLLPSKIPQSINI